eukprot:449995-Pyramimonas_sp.AAC.1
MPALANRRGGQRLIYEVHFPRHGELTHGNYHAHHGPASPEQGVALWDPRLGLGGGQLGAICVRLLHANELHEYK